MTKKNQSQDLVSKGIPLNDLTASRLTKDGAEICNPNSRTVSAYLPTMGERIRRYLKSPTLQRDLYNDPNLWDPDDAEIVFNDDGIKVSVHETRYKEGLKKAKARKSERDAEEKVKAEKAEAERKAEWTKRVQQAVKEGAEIPLPPSKNGQ
jgi:hypothetical protein